MPKQKIVRVEVKSFAGIREVDLAIPDQHTVFVCGDNRQGKSSLLDAIASVTGGAKFLPETPIRDGEKRAWIKATFDSGMTAERSFSTKNQTGTLKVVMPDGSPAEGGAQGVMNELIGSGMSLDPSRFRTMSKDKQEAILRTISGVDLEPLNKKRKGTYGKRAELGVLHRQAEGAVREAGLIVQGLPAEPLVISELLEEKDRITKHNEGVKAQEIKLEEAKASLATVEAKIAEYQQAKYEWETHILALPDVLTLKDTFEVSARIQSAEATNETIRHNQKIHELHGRANDLTAQMETLTEELEAIDVEKAELLGQAKWPIQGFSFDNDGHVTYLDRPLESSSDSEQFLIFLMMAMEAQVKDGIGLVLLYNGETLDFDSLKIVDQVATKYGAQVFVERVGTAGPVTYLLVDGLVKTEEVPTP